jgi:hypothetical protein
LPQTIPNRAPIRYPFGMTTDQRTTLIFLLAFAALTLVVLPLYHSPVLMLYLERWGLC